MSFLLAVEPTTCNTIDACIAELREYGIITSADGIPEEEVPDHVENVLNSTESWLNSYQ